MWDRIFLSRASISALGIQQHLLIADAAQEFRREHLCCQHIGILLETVFEIAKKTAELKKRADLSLFNPKIKITFGSGVAARVGTEQV